MTIPPQPPEYVNFFELFHFLAGDQLVVPIGGHRTFLYGYKKYNRGSGRKRTNEQNKQYEPGVNSKCKTRSYVTLCIPVSIYRLTLAWISSENSKTHEECWVILTRLPSLLWTSSHPTGLSAVRCRLATRVTLRQLPSSSSFVQLPSRVPLPTSGHAEISSPKLFVWFRAKTDKGIVCLADLLHSVTILPWTNTNNWYHITVNKYKRLIPYNHEQIRTIDTIQLWTNTNNWYHNNEQKLKKYQKQKLCFLTSRRSSFRTYFIVPTTEVMSFANILIAMIWFSFNMFSCCWINSKGKYADRTLDVYLTNKYAFVVSILNAHNMFFSLYSIHSALSHCHDTSILIPSANHPDTSTSFPIFIIPLFFIFVKLLFNFNFNLYDHIILH